MAEMVALALPRVSKDDVTRALREEVGVGWDDVAHVTATTTLASAIRRTRTTALPIASLLDLVTLPGLPGAMALPLTGFPGPLGSTASEQSERQYRAALARWQNQASGRRILTGVQVDDSLRRFVRDNAPDQVGRALLASRRQYATTVHALVAAGVRPQGLAAKDPAAQLAAAAWAQAEVDVPALGAPRDLLWVDLEELEEGTSAAGRDLLGRVQEALATAFGPVEGVRTIVHHGFYFYSPVQWMLFQVLARTPGVRQVFVVHDDEANPAFSTWRYFFRSEWQVPVPRLVAVTEDATPAAQAFRRVLAGGGADEVPGVEVLECRSPAELVRLWRAEDEEKGEEEGVARFAAAAEQVERYVGRLDRDAGSAAPRLAQLPVGTFLLALHGCIVVRDDGSVTTRLTQDSLLDMVASGHLEVAGGVVAAPLLRRALPYFGGCRTGDEWIERADLLVQAVGDRVAPHGARLADHDDVERTQAAAGNPTRLVPWADLSQEDTDRVRATIAAVVRLLEDTTSRERVVLGDHLDKIRERLDRALRDLADDERRAVEAKLQGMGALGDEEIDVAGLVDVVAMILGRALDAPGAMNGEDPERTKVKELRGLDALGLERLDRDLHLANLAEDAFPTAGTVVGWPFTLDDLRASAEEAVEPVTTGLLEARAQTSGLSDLYLLWLALDGVAEEKKITMSWVSDAGGDRRRLSPLISLLTVPDASAEVRVVVGGIEVGHGPSPAERPAAGSRPEPTDVLVDDDDLAQAVDSLPTEATSSARACSRRFAIQWAMGPTASFGPEHLQSMLHGNVVAALRMKGQENTLGALAAGNVLWPQTTPGQRISSLAKAVVKEGGAKPEWVLTLKGSKDGTGDLDAAYQLAVKGQHPDDLDLAPRGPVVLPSRAESAEVCAVCPVQARCLEWRDPRDEK